MPFFSHSDFIINGITMAKYTCIATTLEYLIAEHARLTILNIFSTLLALNRSCSLNYFGVFVQPARLLGPALLLYFLK